VGYDPNQIRGQDTAPGFCSAGPKRRSESLLAVPRPS